MLDVLPHAGIVRLLLIGEDLTMLDLHIDILIRRPPLLLLHQLPVIHLQLVSHAVCSSSGPGDLAGLGPRLNLDLVNVTEKRRFFDPTLIVVLPRLILPGITDFELLRILLNLLDQRFDFEVYALLVWGENDGVGGLSDALCVL